MKSNKSLLFLLVGTLFILSSCSQARYGSMMRKAKPSKVENIASNKQKKDQVNIVNNHSQDEEIKIEEVIAIEDENSNNPTVNSSIVNKTEIASTVAEPKGGENLNPIVQFKSKNPISTKKVNRIKNKVQDKLEKSNAADSDLGSLLILILIIILILAIIDLILGFLPGIVATVVYIILLVLLIMWLMQFLN